MGGWVVESWTRIESGSLAQRIVGRAWASMGGHTRSGATQLSNPQRLSSIWTSTRRQVR